MQGHMKMMCNVWAPAPKSARAQVRPLRRFWAGAQARAQFGPGPTHFTLFSYFLAYDFHIILTF